MSVQQVGLPPSERPGGWGRWRRVAEAALADGQVHDGIAEDRREARLVVKRIRRAATVLGARLRASYVEEDGQIRWYVRVFIPEETEK